MAAMVDLLAITVKDAASAIFVTRLLNAVTNLAEASTTKTACSRRPARSPIPWCSLRRLTTP